MSATQFQLFLNQVWPAVEALVNYLSQTSLLHADSSLQDEFTHGLDESLDEPFNTFHVNFPFLNFLQTSENFWFDDIFRGIEMEH